jgi:aminopeptidase-like protein
MESLEGNVKLKATTLCEPQLGKRGLFPTLSKGYGSNKKVLGNVTAMDLLNMWSYCDGDTDLLEIANKINIPLWDLTPVVNIFKDEGLLKEVDI